MKVTVKNLGTIKQADVTIGDLTIICGQNNTGKSYVTHATYGFFDYLLSNASFPVDGHIIETLLEEGAVQLPLQPYQADLALHIDNAAKNYSEMLFQVFASNEKLFQESELKFDLENTGDTSFSQVQLTIGSAKKSVLKIQSSPDNMTLDISLIVDKSSDDIPPRHIIENMISDSITKAVLNKLIPKPFLASAERTGAAIFQKELDFTRNRLVEMLGDKSSKISLVQLLGKFSGEYPLAVRRNVDFIREIPHITNRESYISKHHPELLTSFQDIIGGEYKVSRDGEVQFIPASNKRIRLSMVESSSAVRSLLDIGFYLRHEAEPGDLLMVDEPELNLHPENQRRIARLFARLVNIGIRVFITTHSDYIIKELNTLIMLNQQDEYLETIAKQENYLREELLDAEKLRVYIAKDDLILVDGMTRKTRCGTLVPADIDTKLGIEAPSFDKTIEEMNRIQEEIVWGVSADAGL